MIATFLGWSQAPLLGIKRTQIPMQIPETLQIPEILAPAGGREQFFAALNSGADAVYLGLQSFNARARAENFSLGDLHELIPIAHQYGMKVLVTLNILIKQRELRDLVDILAKLEELEVDAVIVQDLGVVRLVNQYFPRLKIHASTQMAIHNEAGIQAALGLGIKRVVLAREMTVTELQRIKKSLGPTPIELEVFCHGSLCYSYSGLCFFSGAEDARSGNRGECAYTCRQPYKIINEPGQGFLFSMKDLNTTEVLDRLVEAGVHSLKIEGRKKDAQYVATTVRLYRERLDKIYGFPTKVRQGGVAGVLQDRENPARRVSVQNDLAVTFSRAPTTLFTQGRYFENVIDLNHASHQGLLIGEVKSVNGQWISITTAVDLEYFDGLRILPADGGTHSSRYQNEHIEFSLRQMRIGSKMSPIAKANQTVEILVHSADRTLVAGDLVYKVRSRDLKARVQKLSQPPVDARFVARLPLAIYCQAEVCATKPDTILDLAHGELPLKLLVRAAKFGQIIGEVHVYLTAQKSRNDSCLKHDLAAEFGILGRAGFYANTFEFEGDEAWFVPRGRIRDLKRMLEDMLQSRYEDFVTTRRQSATQAVLALPKESGSLQLDRANIGSPPTFIVKVDHLEYLNHAAQFVKPAKNSLISPELELVFEPKKSYLASKSAEELVEQLAEYRNSLKIKIRISLPTVIRAWDLPILSRWIKALIRSDFCQFEVGNLGALELLNAWGKELDRRLDVDGDFTLYALNSEATRFWGNSGINRVCLSIEDDLTNISHHLSMLSSQERGKMTAILYKDTPLFIAEACTLTALHGGCPTAQVCGYRTLEIENPKGERFFVAHDSCKSVVYGSKAFAISHRQKELKALGINNFRIDFLCRQYSGKELTDILQQIFVQEQIAETYSANLDRQLL